MCTQKSSQMNILYQNKMLSRTKSFASIIIITKTISKDSFSVITMELINQKSNFKDNFFYIAKKIKSKTIKNIFYLYI